MQGSAMSKAARPAGRSPVAFTHRLVLIICLAGLGCSSRFDPTTVDLNGRWTGAPNALGVATLTLDLTEATGGGIGGAGQFTATSSDGPPGAVDILGFRIVDQLTFTLTFHLPDRVFSQALTGRIEDLDRFFLVFPADPSPLRVVFRRR